jgi:hypothetical protein
MPKADNRDHAADRTDWCIRLVGTGRLKKHVTRKLRLPLLPGLVSRPMMRFSCPAAGPRSRVVQMPLD